MSVHTDFAIAIKIVEKDPLFGDLVMVRRNVVAEDGQSGIAVAFLHIAEYLVVGTILLDYGK